MGIQVQHATKATVRPVMNITPLVDVVLVLLIIFMVVTPLMTKQFWLHLPKKDDNAQADPPPDTQTSLVVTVDTDGTIKVNQNAIPKAEFKDRIGRMLAARADKTLYFDAADDASYAATVDVMDLALRCGAASIAIMTKKAAQ